MSSLRNPGRELHELSAAFEERLRRGKDEAARDRRKSRSTLLLQEELSRRTAAVAETSQLGLNHREVAESVELYLEDGRAAAAVVGGRAEDGRTGLRKLTAGELKHSVEGHAYWTGTRLLDHQVSD